MASFTRPEMKVERMSYDIMTPSAARGILEAIYWKPGIQWVIDRIRVLNPIRFTHVRRNEIDTKIPVKGANGIQTAMRNMKGSLGIHVDEHRQQRAGMILKDVRYGIEAHFEFLGSSEAHDLNDNTSMKHREMFMRRASRGQYFHHPYLGTREFPAYFEPVEAFPSCHQELKGEIELGIMLLDFDFIPDRRGHVVDGHSGARLDVQPRFFAATMRDGVVAVPRTSSSGGES
jgi:CRISPR-associated protein Cas5d